MDRTTLDEPLDEAGLLDISSAGDLLEAPAPGSASRKSRNGEPPINKSDPGTSRVDGSSLYCVT